MERNLPTPIREKKHRLDDAVYIGNHRISFTLCVDNRKRLFTSLNIVSVFEGTLNDCLNRNNCEALIYLFMPDHLHIVTEGKDTSSNHKKMIVDFKQRTGFWLGKNKSDFQWQKNFYDHILRPGDDFNKDIEYILLNPVRANLVSNWKDYPYKGSTIFQIEEWSSHRSDFVHSETFHAG